MRSGGGSPKGAEFERFCAKRLSLWITNGKRDDCLWRTSLSGGRATFQLRKDIINRAQAGDLTAISAEAIALCDKYLFELKFYKDLNFAALMTSGKGVLRGFWLATCNAAVRVDKEPVLIAKQNRYPTIALCPVGCDLFPRDQWWAKLNALEAEIYWFDFSTKVVRPRIKRPNTARMAAE